MEQNARFLKTRYEGLAIEDQMTQYFFFVLVSVIPAWLSLPIKDQLHVALFKKIIAFWEIIPCSMVDTCAAAIFREQDERSMFLRIVGKDLPDCKALHPIRPDLTYLERTA